MKSFAFVAALVALVPYVSGLTVNTITTGVTECEPVLFSWTGGTAPYYLSIVQGTNTAASPLENFGEQQSESYTWNVNIASGTSFTTIVKDSTGATAFSDAQTVQSGTDTSCLNSSSVSGSVGSTAASAATAAGSSNSAATTAASGTSAAPSAASKSGSSSASGSSSSGSASSPSSTNVSTSKNSGAGRSSVGSFGIAAVMGLIGAALF